MNDEIAVGINISLCLIKRTNLNNSKIRNIIIKCKFCCNNYYLLVYG